MSPDFVQDLEALSSSWSMCQSLVLQPLPNTQSALIGQLTHTWASTANNNKAALLNQFWCQTSSKVRIIWIWNMVM